jgi:ADP-heptose:LPS heptosyltransferase
VKLGRIPRAKYLSLQTGPGSEQLEELGAAKGMLPIENLSLAKTSGQLGFEDIAAIMTCLDLVITVDTATAHLAGALGVSCWVLVACISDWRWGNERLDSPWYPTVRLFRQRRLGCWRDVFHNVAEELYRIAS